jgi:hypothetical protein
LALRLTRLLGRALRKASSRLARLTLRGPLKLLTGTRARLPPRPLVLRSRSRLLRRLREKQRMLAAHRDVDRLSESDAR